jgi:hypothetical protein
MSREIINRWHITITQNLASKVNASTDVNIFIPFQPDEMIVKQLCFVTGTAGPTPYRIISNLVQDQVLCIIMENDQNVNLDNHFILKQYVNQIYNFQIQSFDNTVTPPTPLWNLVTDDLADTSYSLLLEFLQHAK